jgi:hypothetical protein
VSKEVSMPSNIENAYTTIAVHKASRMAEKETYKRFIDEVLIEFGITDPQKAFLLGAFDGMLYELASTLGQAYMKPQVRKRVLRKIIAVVEPSLR